MKPSAWNKPCSLSSLREDAQCKRADAGWNGQVNRCALKAHRVWLACRRPLFWMVSTCHGPGRCWVLQTTGVGCCSWADDAMLTAAVHQLSIIIFVLSAFYVMIIMWPTCNWFVLTSETVTKWEDKDTNWTAAVWHINYTSHIFCTAER